MSSRRQKKPFAPVREGVLEHHERMAWAEIAVFHTLLVMANRAPSKGVVGFCGVSGNELAKRLGKSREATHRALKGLADKRFLRPLDGGYLVLNFDGESSVDHEPEAPTAEVKKPAGKQASPDPSRLEYERNRLESSQGRLEYERNRLESSRDNRRDVDVSEDGDDLGEGSAPAPTVPESIGPVYWDGAIRQVCIDEQWLRGEIEDYQAELGVALTRVEYMREAERLRMELLKDPRLRACVRKADGKPSSASQFKRLATYTAGWFRTAIQRKAERMQPARASPKTFGQLKDSEIASRIEKARERDQRKEIAPSPVTKALPKPWDT